MVAVGLRAELPGPLWLQANGMLSNAPC